MTEITLKLDDPAKTAALLRDASAAAGSGGCNHTAGMHARWLAEQIEEQVQPTVEEPEAFGSIVQAWHPSEDPSSTHPDLWQRSPMNGKHYWENRNGVCEVWSDLVHPEVLRVGIGDDQSDSYNMGRADFAEAMRRDISALRAAAVGAERKNAYDNSLATIAALLGES